MADAHGFAALAAALSQNPSIAAIYVDADGTIQSWNRGAETLFGHSAAEAIGKRADLIVPEPLRDQHWAGFNRAVRSSWPGSSSWGPIEPLRRDGETVAAEVFLLPLQHAADGLHGILAFFRRRDGK